jgi:FixJ family two-component response regulator
LLDRIREALERNEAARKRFERRASLAARLSRLTAREREVMEAIVAGLANKAIAAKLEISPKTVEAHRARIMTKMKADSVADLVRASLEFDREGAESGGRSG